MNALLPSSCCWTLEWEALCFWPAAPALARLSKPTSPASCRQSVDTKLYRNSLKLPSAIKVQQLKIEPLSFKLNSWARDLWFHTEAGMFHQCGEWHVSKSSTKPQFQMLLQDFHVSGPGCLSAKPLRTDPLVELVSPGVLHILQHVMSLLMLA